MHDLSGVTVDIFGNPVHQEVDVFRHVPIHEFLSARSLTLELNLLTIGQVYEKFVFDHQGDLQQVIVTFMDVTERKRAEQAFWESEDWYRSLSPTSHIRCLGMEDYDDLLALWHRASLHSLKPAGRDSREAVARQLAIGVQTILGLEVSGELVGAVVATHDSRKGWINRLVVEPDYRRRGYGAQLIAAAEDVLSEQGMRVIAALVESDNPASLALFRKEGYIEIDSKIHYLSKRDSKEA